MQCRRCGFENLPGLTTCMRCGSVLAVTTAVNVHPPRAGWRRFYRPLIYAFNTLQDARPRQVRGRLNGWLNERTAGLHVWLWIILSAIPGLGHLASGRLGALLWLWPAWALALTAGVLGQGARWGSVAIGVSIALHSWIVMDAATIRRLFESVLGRLAIGLVLWFVFNGFLYGAIERHLIGGAVPNLAIVGQGIAPADFVLFTGVGELRRGDLVRYHIRGTGPPISFYGITEPFQILGGDVVGVLLGFPGERVHIGHGRLTVLSPGGHDPRVFAARLGRRLKLSDPEAGRPPAPPGTTFNLPVLAGIFGQGEQDSMDFDFLVPQDHFLCLPLNFRAGGDLATPLMIIHAGGLPEVGQVRGHAVMVYNTFWHRRKLQRQPLPII